MLQTKKQTKSCGAVVDVHLLWTWKGQQLVLALFTSIVLINLVRRY